MFGKSRLVCVGWLLLVLSAGAAGAYDNGDWQFWNTDSAEYGFADQWKARVESEFYFGDDMSDFFYWHIDTGVARKLGQHLELGLFYRYLREKKSDGWEYENRPHANATVMGNLGPLAWSDRNRLEFRARESADNSWRYRNRLRLSPTAAWTSLKIQPYVDDEIFYDFDAREMNQNRASAGVSFKPAKCFKLEIYYMLQTTWKAGWIQANIIGTQAKFNF